VITLLQASPLLLLFAVAAIGFPLGRLRVGQSRLGIAAVLFVGLAFGAVDPALKLPEIVYQLGLVLFVYTVGLGSGPAFFDALRRRGLRDNAFVVSMLLVGAALAVVLHRLLGLGAAQTAGLFTGALTNTPPGRRPRVPHHLPPSPSTPACSTTRRRYRSPIPSVSSA
jgi:putative transport protein